MSYLCRKTSMSKYFLYIALFVASLQACKQSVASSAAADQTVNNQTDTTVAVGPEQDAIRYELPAYSDKEMVIRHTGFTLSYNQTHNTPNWSAWCLTADHTEGTVERSTKFWADPSIPTPYRVDYYDYKGSGYDRGHMCPAGDMKWSEEAMHDCFYMSNMCPQTGSLNSGAWNKLEMKCREWAKNEGKLYIVCGPVYDKRRHEQIGIDHAIDVPEGFFKAILSLRPGHEKAIAFYFYNDESRQSYKTATLSVDEAEELTGLDLFAALEDKLEAKLESTNNLAAFQ